jgi:NADH-quinone oxidoreductase subunit M
LTVTLLPVVVLASLESIRKNQEVYYFWILFLGGTLTLCFCASEFLVFYVLFEILGFPMFLLVGQYGPRPQRVSAAYKFFVYTFGGAAFVLPVLVYFQFWWGTTGITFLVGHQFTEYEQILFFGLCAVPFAVKIPLVPFHLWLPEAHVEAPTPVSMLLAGLLLKTGGYAFLRFLLPAFPMGAYVWGPALCGVGLFSVIFASAYALVQVDMKRMIAYASVAHMSVVFLGIFSGVPTGVAGATYLMLAHGYTSAGLFGGIGVLYDRYHTRTIRQYGGVASVMPIFAGFFFVLTLGNLSFPFTGGFVGEFMILSSLALQNFMVVLLAGSTVFLSLCYSVWLFNRLFYGPVGSDFRIHQEATPVELGVLGWCSFGCVGLGFAGGVFIGYTQHCYLGVLYHVLPG